MNNRMVQGGCSSSRNNGGSGSGSTMNEAEAAEAEQRRIESVERYPKRVRRHVNYSEQLDSPADDNFICRYLFDKNIP
jgi:hypothetical protein